MILKGGETSNVLLHEVPNGPFRSESLQPGREILVTAQASGFAPAHKKLILAEGEKVEATFVLKPR